VFPPESLDDLDADLLAHYKKISAKK